MRLREIVCKDDYFRFNLLRCRGQVRFLNRTMRVGKRYRERDVWLTLGTVNK